MATILIGIGNPVLSDDSVGLQVARGVATRLSANPEIAVRELYSGGISLMEAMAGYDRALIVDAMCTPRAIPGTIHFPTFDALFETRNSYSSHDEELTTALELGRLAGLRLPGEILISGIEAADVTSFSEQLTPEVERALPTVVEDVLQKLRNSAQWGEWQ